jgi:hypothetical protein
MKRIVSLICPLLIIAISGCVQFKSGGGPVSRDEAQKITGFRFAPASAEQQQAFAAMDREKTWSKEMPSFAYPGCGDGPRLKTAQKNNMTMGKIFKCGWVHSRVQLMERSLNNPTNETFCREETTFVPGYPIIWPVWTGKTDTYLQSTGEQVGKTGMFGLGLGGILFAKGKMLCPTTVDVPKGKAPEKYNAFDGWFLATGIIGGGRVNHKYYGQILWTAFPVGTAD